MLKIAIIVGWIVCGFFTYGFAKGAWKQFIETLTYIGYNWKIELICHLAGVFWPAGLFAALVMIVTYRERPIFCFRIPKELKRGYGTRQG